MRSPLRSALLLGSAYALMSATNALADDPLVPEGAERPKMGKELVLPPIINEAPPGTEIVLPPPGQEHLLGQRPDGAKLEARISDEAPVKAEAKIAPEPEAEPQAVAEAAPVEEPRPAKKRARKPKTEAVASAEPEVKTAPVAEMPADKALYAGIKQTAVPDQSLIVAEDASAAAAQDLKPAKIEKTNARLDDPRPAMGGPELSGPPKPSDGMTDAPKPIRDGDVLTPKQERAIAEAPPKAVKEPEVKVDTAKVEPAKAPAIERFEIAQATAAPLPVTPGMKRADNAAPDWRFALSASAGYAMVSTATQRYQGRFDTIPAGANRQVNSVTQGVVASDDDGDAVPLELALAANLDGAIEPLSIFGIGESARPWLRVSVGGSDTTFRNAGSFATGATEGVQFLNPDGSGVFNVLGATGTANFRAKQETRGAKILYGQTSEGAGASWTGYGGVAYTERKLRQRIAVTATGIGSAANIIVPGAATAFTGGYDTRLTTGSTSFILGLGVEAPLDSAKRWSVDGYAQLSYDINRVTGRDTVDLRNGGSVLAGTARLRRTDSSAGYGAGLGLNYKVTDSVKLRLGADYASQEAAPEVIRDGTGQTRVTLDREDVVSGSLTATFEY
jgi:hypothetical protein